jgi:hypothetical protein
MAQHKQPGDIDLIAEEAARGIERVELYALGIDHWILDDPSLRDVVFKDDYVVFVADECMWIARKRRQRGREYWDVRMAHVGVVKAIERIEVIERGKSRMFVRLHAETENPGWELEDRYVPEQAFVKRPRAYMWPFYCPRIMPSLTVPLTVGVRAILAYCPDEIRWRINIDELE